MKVLVVDDDAPSRYLASMVLRSAGYEVETARDGVEALEKGRLSRPDLLLSDILMPRMDGYRLVMEWRADAALADTRFVFYTASYTDPADEKFAIDLGADLFLVKPMDPEELLRSIGALHESGARVPEAGRTGAEAEVAVMREYSERLVHKLESKVLELQRANAMLSGALEALTDEVEVKRVLVEELTAKIEEAARLGEEARVLQAAVGSSSVATAVLEAGGDIVFANRSFDALVATCDDHDDSEDAETLELAALVAPRIIEQAFRGISYRGEVTVRCGSDLEVPVDLSVSPVASGDSDVTHVVIEAFAVACRLPEHDS